MSRSPLAYPLTRGIDGDSGGAADLQTDIMRFMAILALCLVAIFALVQSLPMAPQPLALEPTPSPAAVIEQPSARPARSEPQAAPPPVRAAEPSKAQQVALTRPAWTPKYRPAPSVAEQSPATKPVERSTPDAKPPAPPANPSTERVPAASATEQRGFTLRFESDLALTRLVAGGQVGFYAIEQGRARRMSVHNSRISFWDASTPNEFHEMEAATVPQPAIAALGRSGADASTVRFGVTLPARLRDELAQLMREHSGGALVIGMNGDLQLEAGK